MIDKKISGVSPVTVNNYRVTLTLFVRYLNNPSLSSLTYDMVCSYVLDLYDRDLSRGTVSSYIRDVRIFLRWISQEYGLSFNPSKIKIPKSPKKIVHIYTDTEIRYIFDLISTSVPWITARNKAIVALMLDSGLRQCEVCGLLRKDVDKERKVMKVSGKGAKERIVPLGNMSICLLDEYFSICPFACEYVFIDRTGKQLSKNAVKLFTYRLEKELPFQFSSHKLRHNYATNYCIDHVHEKGSTDVFDLSILMGHESVETTKKYEHFAHELIAVENSISHLDGVYDLGACREN